MMRASLCLTLLFYFSTVVAQGQIRVSGKVTDNTGSSLPGVNIVIQGTTSGTISDLDGRFTLSGVKKGSIIIASYIGMQSQKVAVHSGSINIVMLPGKSSTIAKSVGPYTEFAQTFKYFKKNTTNYSGTDLPNNEQMGGDRNLFKFDPMPKFSAIRIGYHRNSFLNPIFGTNRENDILSHKAGSFFGLDYDLSFITSLIFNFSYFSSNYQYGTAIEEQDVNYRGYEFSLSKQFGLTQLPVLRKIIPKSYLGLGFHLGKTKYSQLLYANSAESEGSTNLPYWKLGLSSYPLAWINQTGWFNRRLRRAIARTELNFEYKQSVSTAKGDSFNGWSLGLGFKPKLGIKDFSVEGLLDLPGSNGENAEYIKERIYFTYGYINSSFSNQKTTQGIEKVAGWGHNIAFKYSYFYPLMVDLSYFRSSHSLVNGSDSTSVVHQGLEIAPTYGITSAVKWAVPYAGFGIQLAHLSNKEMVFDVPEADNKKVSGIVWKLGVISHFKSWLLITEYRHSLLKEETKFGQFTITAGFNFGMDYY